MFVHLSDDIQHVTCGQAGVPSAGPSWKMPALDWKSWSAKSFQLSSYTWNNSCCCENLDDAILLSSEWLTVDHVTFLTYPDSLLLCLEIHVGAGRWWWGERARVADSTCCSLREGCRSSHLIPPHLIPPLSLSTPQWNAATRCSRWHVHGSSLSCMYANTHTRSHLRFFKCMWASHLACDKELHERPCFFCSQDQILVSRSMSASHLRRHPNGVIKSPSSLWREATETLSLTSWHLCFMCCHGSSRLNTWWTGDVCLLTPRSLPHSVTGMWGVH